MVQILPYHATYNNIINYHILFRYIISISESRPNFSNKKNRPFNFSTGSKRVMTTDNKVIQTI